MNIYDSIFSRRTVRDFKEKEIESDIIKKIIDAGLQAPSHNHMRQWEFIIINDKSARLNLINKVSRDMTEDDAAKAVDSWGYTDKSQREMYIYAVPIQYKMLLSAGCLIIPCFHQKKPLLQPDNLSALNGFASIWCCIENMLLAASSEGIHGVTRIPYYEEILHIKETLKIPEGYEIPCYVALGYPNEEAPQIKQLDIKADERMHFNKW